MLIDIPALLSKKKLAEIQTLIAEAKFVDGKLSAGAAAQRVKNNEEIAADAQQLQRLNNLVMTPLVSHPIFRMRFYPIGSLPRFLPAMAPSSITASTSMTRSWVPWDNVIALMSP